LAKTPPAAHRWNQSWTVLLGPNRSGNWSHWQPVRNRKMIALIIFLQLAVRRPVGLLGQKSLRIGSIRCHNASGISQIVPSGLRVVLRRFMRAAPIATIEGVLFGYKSLMQWAFHWFSDSFLGIVPVWADLGLFRLTLGKILPVAP